MAEDTKSYRYLADCELSIWKDHLLDEDEGSKDIFLLFVGNVIIMYIVSYSIIEHIFCFVHDCCYSLALINLKGCFDTDARCSFWSYILCRF